MLLDKKVSVLWVMNAAAVAATATWLVSIALVFKGKTETSRVVSDLLASYDAAVRRIPRRTRSMPLLSRHQLAAADVSRVYYATYLALLALANAEDEGTSGHFETYSVEIPDGKALATVFARHPAVVDWVNANRTPLSAAIQLHRMIDGQAEGSDGRTEGAEAEYALLMARCEQLMERLRSVSKDVKELEQKRDRLTAERDDLRREADELRGDRPRLREEQ